MAQAKYITVAELAEAFDTRDLSQLSSDTGTSATVNESNTILLNCIERASSDVESSALRGGRYSASDLTTLQTNDDWTLKGTVAALAVGHLYRRRGATVPADIQSEIDEAKQTLADLREGIQVFNDADAISAGQPKSVILTESQRARLGQVSESRYFPRYRENTV